MTKLVKLKISELIEEKSVRVTLDLPAAVHRDLVTYAEILERHTGQPIKDPVKLVPAMLARFMSTDRAFKTAKKSRQEGKV
jgi:hypothetical protein